MRTLLVCLMAFCSCLYAEGPFDKKYQDQAKETLAKLSIDEKIGQLFIVGTYSNYEDAAKEGQLVNPIEYAETAIKKYHIGSVLFKYYWTPAQLKSQVTYLRSISKINLLTFHDMEWGLNMRHKEVPPLPKNIALGAIQNDSLVYDVAREIGKEAKIVDIDCPLLPVVDINTVNPPYIGDRSFGSSPENVSKKAVVVMKGITDEGRVACAKHFPGLGATSINPHFALPEVSKNMDELTKCDLVPFQALIEAGVPMIMTVHLTLPNIDSSMLPATLSPVILTDLLRKKLHFNGVIVSDDLLMKAVQQSHTPEQIVLLAFKAGCDLIMSSKDIDICVLSIKNALERGEISTSDIDNKVLRILALKAWTKEHKENMGSVPLTSTLIQKTKKLRSEAFAQAISVQNEITLSSPTCVLQVGGTAMPFVKKVRFPSLYVSEIATDDEIDWILKALDPFKSVIITLCPPNSSASLNYGLSKEVLSFLKKVSEKLEKDKKCSLYVVFGSPFVKNLLDKKASIVFAFNPDDEAQKAAADIVLKKKKAEGILCFP